MAFTLDQISDSQVSSVTIDSLDTATLLRDHPSSTAKAQQNLVSSQQSPATSSQQPAARSQQLTASSQQPSASTLQPATSSCSSQASRAPESALPADLDIAMQRMNFADIAMSDRRRQQGSEGERVELCPFHLRLVQVYELTEEGNLGLLLSSLQVKGFHCSEARANGWQIDDQIVHVNGNLVQSFEEFAVAFKTAKADGLPIEFGVLRRERRVDLDEGVEDILGNLTLQDLASRVTNLSSSKAAQPKNMIICRKHWTRDWSTDPDSFPGDPAENYPRVADMALQDIPHNSRRQCMRFAQAIREDLIMESNLPVQALLQRRRDYAANSVDQSVDSLATRLATQRIDGLSNFVSPAPVATNGEDGELDKEAQPYIQHVVVVPASGQPGAPRCCKDPDETIEKCADSSWGCCQSSKVKVGCLN